jgi:hypothetical protein
MESETPRCRLRTPILVTGAAGSVGAGRTVVELCVANANSVEIQ